MDDDVDMTESDLLCSEDSDMCVGNFECYATYDSEIPRSLNHEKAGSNWSGFKYELGFPLLSEESLRLLAETERVYMPKEDYLVRLRCGDLDLSVRKEALDWIWKVHNSFGFGPLTFCLSTNYLDRLLSIYNLPRGQWSVELLAIACLSIATKVEENKPLLKIFEVERLKLKFEPISVQRMELLVLSKLQWKMHACTPCSFIDYFITKIPYHQHTDTLNSSISRSTNLILKIIRGVDFLEFKPSEIAAAVAISVSREVQDTDIDEAITCFVIVQKDRVLKCVEMIRDLCLVSVSSANLGRNYRPFLL